MIAHEAAQQYLDRLKRALRFLPAEDRDAIIAEIESHIADRTSVGGKSIADTLETLGDPDELARAYIEQYKLEDAVVRSAHPTLLITILEKTGRSLAAGFLGLISLTCYLSSIVFAAMAVLKPILPQNVGYWVGPHAHTLGILDKAPENKVEVLGYWMIPVALMLGLLFFFIGRALTRLGGRVLLRKTKALPA